MFILDLLGIGRFVRALGALVAIIALIGGAVLIFAWKEDSARAERLTKGNGDIRGFSTECRMYSPSDRESGLRRLSFVVPCDEVEYRKSIHPDRHFSIERSDIVQVEYLTRTGVEIVAKANRADLRLRSGAQIGDRITFYYDPARPRSRLMADQPSAIARYFNYGLGWMAILVLGLIATMLGGYQLLGRMRETPQ